MLLLEETYRELLTEQDAKNMLIQQAIRNKWVVTIDYRGDGIINAGQRNVEPVCLGITKAGNAAVRAWQVQGRTDTPENMPGWRLFRMDRIGMVKTNKVPYTTQRPDYNPRGDRSLIKILLMAKF